MAVLGTTHFGDDWMAWIEGHNIVVFVCKNGEFWSLKGVYFIPWLATNIMSIEQLDEVGYKIDINTGMMKIREPGGLLLARVEREVTHLYLLHINLPQPTCFVVHRWGDEVAWYCAWVTHRAMLGEEVKDREIIAKMLQSLSPRFKHITITIKTLLDVSTMFVADMTGWLKKAEEVFMEAPTWLQ
jgi:hypothetical protein